MSCKVCGLRNCDLKHNRLVQFAALGAARAVHVRVVGIDVAALLAAENPVLGVSRPEPAPAHFGINPQTTQRAKQDGHINEYQRGNIHVMARRRVNWSRAVERCAR